MADDVTPRAKLSRRMRILLVLSLALNLAVIGLIVGAGVSGRFGDRPPRSFDFGLGPVARALESDERRAIGRELRRDGALRGYDMRQGANDMVAALRAEPFEPETLRELMALQAAHVGQLQRSAQDALLDQITAMTPERRAAFAEKLEQELQRGRARRDEGSSR